MPAESRHKVILQRVLEGHAVPADELRAALEHSVRLLEGIDTVQDIVSKSSKPTFMLQ